MGFFFLYTYSNISMLIIDVVDMVIPFVDNTDPVWQKVFINHYMTKSLSEFVAQKMNRTDAVFDKRTLDFNYFWRINEKTQDKIDYLKDMGLDY